MVRVSLYSLWDLGLYLSRHVFINSNLQGNNKRWIKKIYIWCSQPTNSQFYAMRTQACVAMTHLFCRLARFGPFKYGPLRTELAHISTSSVWIGICTNQTPISCLERITNMVWIFSHWEFFNGFSLQNPVLAKTISCCLSI